MFSNLYATMHHDDVIGGVYGNFESYLSDHIDSNIHVHVLGMNVNLKYWNIVEFSKYGILIHVSCILF